MSARLVWFQLVFPSTVEADQVTAALRALNGLSTRDRREAIVLQVVGQAGQVNHHLAVADHRAAAVQTQLPRALPGLTLEPLPEQPPLATDAAWRLRLSSAHRPLYTDMPEQVSAGLLAALAAAGDGEQVVLQWLLGPVRRPVVVPTRHAPLLPDRWTQALARAPFITPQPPDSESRRAVRLKQGEPGWRAVGRIAVRAKQPRRARQLLGQVMAVLRTVQAPGVTIGAGHLPPAVMTGYRRPLRWNLAVNVHELTGLVGWPLGDTARLPVRHRSARLLPVPHGVPGRGRVVAVAVDGRPLCLNPPEALQHLHVIGPTGGGKSTLLLNLILQDIEHGRGVVVIDPKADLVRDLLARIPEHRRDDVVVLDPSDDQPVGLNPLQGAAPELVADQVLGILSRLHRDSWGPRTADVLHASLLTLARAPGMSLAALPLLLTNPAFRRRLVGQLDDPFGVEPFWAWYDQLSPEQLQQVVAPVLNKVRPFLLRPSLRGVIGQAAPRFSLRSVFTDRKVLLVALPKGLLGPEGSRLLGTLLLNQLWQTALSRVTLPSERRHPVFVYVDEVQEYLGLPTDIGELLATARGLGVGFTLAHQHLGQLPPELRAAVLANARSRVVFQTGAEDAVVLTRQHPELTAEDVAGLDRYQIYLSLVVAGQVSAYMSGHTRPPGPEMADPALIRRLSRERYGVARADSDAALQALIEQPSGAGRGSAGSAVGTRRRPA